MLEAVVVSDAVDAQWGAIEAVKGRVVGEAAGAHAGTAEEEVLLSPSLAAAVRWLAGSAACDISVRTALIDFMPEGPDVAIKETH